MADDEKADLLAALRESRDVTAATLLRLDAAALHGERYENGWDGREILAHLAAIEWTYPRLIEIARTARAGDGEAGRADGGARDGMDGYNARQVEKRRGMPAASLIREWSENRDALIRAVEEADAGLLSAPVRSAGGRVGTLGLVLREVAIGHVAGHLADITGQGR